MSEVGTLYIVSTPIGNLGDLTIRADQILRDCDLIACEDSRITSRLLAKQNIEKELFLYRDDNEKRVAPNLIAKLKRGSSIALVSDAGTPSISDPGFRIVRECRREGISVVPIPGACAVTAALSVSGLPTDSFLFLGFLPPKTSARKRIFSENLEIDHTLIFYESPHRILKCLDDMLEIYGPERTICIAKEITKMHEFTMTGPISAVADKMKNRSTKGEFVVMIAKTGYTI